MRCLRLGCGANCTSRYSACDVFLSLFFTKTGKFTEEEFDTAHAQQQKAGRPKIYTFFKDTKTDISPERKDDLNSLWAFQEKLGKTAL